METNRDKAAGAEGGTSIRLRYSRQFQNGGHAHTIDAETTLSVGASPERREQVIRELELGVEQLARQIVQRGSRPTSEIRPQAAVRPTPEPATSAASRPPTGSPVPATRTPVSESMPATPSSGGEGNTVKLPQFINAIKRRWDMSLNEAMSLLNVTTLDGVNLREVYAQLQAIMEARGAQSSRPNAQGKTTQANPVVEAPRQAGRNIAQPPSARPPTNQATSTTATRGPGAMVLRESAKAAPPTVPVAAPVQEPVTTAEPARTADFAGSPKAPIPIQSGVVRDLAARGGYKFEEEEDEDEDAEDYDLPMDEDAARQQAQVKLDALREIRGSNVASAERLGVLNNIVSSQISEEQLEKLIQAAWGITTKKRLKTRQVEELISWGKEDYFVDEVENVLKLLEEGEA